MKKEKENQNLPVEVESNKEKRVRIKAQKAADKLTRDGMLRAFMPKCRFFVNVYLPPDAAAVSAFIGYAFKSFIVFRSVNLH